MPSATNTILVDLIPPEMSAAESLDRLRELDELLQTYGGVAVVKTYQRRVSPHPRTFIGPGKADSLAEEGKALGAKLIVINDRLKPRQAYLLGETFGKAGIQVWDRLDLILKIFAKHARTTEARLEIELASIRHMGPRIYGMGMELSRQGGGGASIGGQGETNTELMKRHLRAREEKIKEKLEQYRNVRRGHQAARKRKGLATVAIVGYTNAGKTTLLNALTKRKEYAADELFATLDTRVGKLFLPQVGQPGQSGQAGREVLISDTIGFIRRLPPELLNAFASTLSEAVAADLLLHVVDGSDPHAPEHIRVVDDILERLGAGDAPRLLVVNKTDRLAPGTDGPLGAVPSERWPAVRVSAATGQGLDELRAAIGNKLGL